MCVTPSPAPQTPILAYSRLGVPSSRIDSLDLLRGIAILGIFLMNTQSMGLRGTAYMNPATTLEIDAPFEGLDRAVWVTIHLLADMKFITLFSLMFGAGILLQGDRVAARGGTPWAVHYRRMAVLLLIGTLHGYLLWYGDILFSYAVCGLLLFPIRRLPPWLLILLGLAMIAVPTVCEYSVHNGHFPREQMDQLSRWLFTGQSENEAYHAGGLAELRYRAAEFFYSQTLGNATWTCWRCGGTMLLGFALQRWRFFAGDWSLPAYAFIALTLTPIGWALSGLGVYHNDQLDWTWDMTYDFLPYQFNYIGSLLSCLGYAASGVLLAALVASRSSLSQRLAAAAVAPIRAVGRTALSNYLFQTLVGTTIFYGHGLGYFDRLSRPQLLLIVFPTWIVQLAGSYVYLKFFRQGPVEWAWHYLAYLGNPPAKAELPAQKNTLPAIGR